MFIDDVDEYIENLRGAKDSIRDFDLDDVFALAYNDIESKICRGPFKGLQSIERLSHLVSRLTKDDIAVFYARAGSDEIDYKVVQGICAMQLLVERIVDYTRSTAWWNYHLSAGTTILLNKKERVNETIH